ncbi:MAG TPA: hypothetical protein VM844_03530 [Miltoncostaeaceae bacterium]|nr:hypothetical protein [Miltoncostaeaceae bacterium]
MRRAGPPILPVDAASVPPFARVERGPRGLRLAPGDAPAAAAGDAPAPALRLRAGAPVVIREAAVVAGGRLALATADGVAYSLALPQVRVVHDRRPPGLAAAAGAPLANAGLLRADDGWRVVVLPSLGDVAAGLGPGPAAIRGDGRRVAAAVDGGVEEWDLGEADPVARHERTASALCYAGDGTLLAAAGAAVGAPGLDPAPGSPIAALGGAAAAPRAVARHEDGTISVWEAGSAEPVASWPSPLPGGGDPSLSADGALVAIGSPAGADPVACLARAEDGALVRAIAGARVLAPSPAGDGMVVGGDWGCAWLTPDEEDG